MKDFYRRIAFESMPQIRELIMLHYMLSNSLTETRMKRAAAFLRYTSLFRLTHDRLKALLQVRRDYLEEVLDELLGQYGSVEAYLNEGCGISEFIK